MRFHKLRTTLAKRLLKGTWYIVACKDNYAVQIKRAFKEGRSGVEWNKSDAICLYEDLWYMKP